MIIQLLKNKFLNLLDAVGRKRIILDRVSKDPYLERYYIFLKDRKWFPFNLFIHKFLKSDPDDLHDHPWPYATLILKGGYWEWIPLFDEEGKKINEVRYWRGAGHFRISKASSYHRIELDPYVVCWTLFMPGPQHKEWGFLVHNKWISNEQYLQQRKLQNTLS
jgi:hypothetical protein